MRDFDVIYYPCYSCNSEHGEGLVPILATTALMPCLEPAHVDIPKPRLFIASRSNHSTPERPFLTSKTCSQPCAPQNEPISKPMMPVTVQPPLNLMWRQPFFKLAHPSLKSAQFYKTLCVPRMFKEFLQCQWEECSFTKGEAKSKDEDISSWLLEHEMTSKSPVKFYI